MGPARSFFADAHPRAFAFGVSTPWQPDFSDASVEFAQSRVASVRKLAHHRARAESQSRSSRKTPVPHAPRPSVYCHPHRRAAAGAGMAAGTLQADHG